MENKLTQKQRLEKYQKHIDLILENEKKKQWFITQLDGFVDMMDLPINEIDDEEWSNWENGDCGLVNKLIIQSVSKMYLKTL